MAEHELTVPELDDEVKKELAVLDGDKAVRYLRYQAKETEAYLAALRPKVKNVANFWLVTLSSHAELSTKLSSRLDVQALSYLEDVELIQDSNDFRPFEIVFHFKENPYFSNSTLSKKYSLKPNLSAAPEDGSTNDELRDFDASTDYDFSSTKIEWKSDDKNLCALLPRESQGADDAASDMDPGYEGDQGSFFWYFAAADDIHDIGDILRNDLLPEAYAYFDGRGTNQTEPDSDSEEDELDEEGGDDDEEIDLEESDEEKPEKKKRKL